MDRAISPSIFFMKTNTLSILSIKKIKKNLTVLILLLILLLTLLLTLLILPISSADVFYDYEHKPTVCNYCHVEKGFSIGYYNDENTCDNCHNIKDNIPNLEQTHSNVCNRCHTTPSNDEEYHNIHKGVDCTRCHGAGILPVKPPTGITNCAACHGAIFSSGSDGIHVIHKARLEEICSNCHGTRPSYNPSGITELKSASSDVGKGIVEGFSEEVDKINKKVYAKVIDYKRYTLYEIFKVIFSIFH